MGTHEDFEQFFNREIAYQPDLFYLQGRERPFFHLWMEPSFTDAFLWTIYYESNYHAFRYYENTPYVKELRWKDHYQNGYRYDVDMVVRDTSLNREIFNELIEEVKQISIPIFNHDLKIPNDGVRCGIEGTIVGAIVGYRLAWYIPPKQWEPLAEWFHKMREYLVETLDANNE